MNSPMIQPFHTRTALANGLRELFAQLEQRLSLSTPVNVYLAGGMAVHLYTASRVTTDVDAEFGCRLHIPSDVMVEVTLEDGTQQVVYLDTNYNSTFALMHEDYLDDAIPVDLGMSQIRLYVLSPVDLAVSKIARLADNDKNDIAALVRLGLTSADEIEQRASEAVGGFVGGQAMLRLNLRDAVALAREVENENLVVQRLRTLPLLKNGVGAALTFWRQATSAIEAGGAHGVDWRDVEQRTIVESISKHGQAPSAVASVICEYSPGAVTKAAQDEIRALVERVTAELQVQDATRPNKNELKR